MTILVASGCASGMPGWTWSYAINAVHGEVNYLVKAVPIENGLTDPTLTQDEKDKLALVIEARDYAVHVIGLNAGSAYQTFVNLHGEPLAWNLSASRGDAIEAYQWDIPFAGPMSYLGFFNVNDLIKERNYLVSQGYDTFGYELDAFSTLGLLPDPIASTMLQRSVARLVDTVMHELTHNTVWCNNDAVFSESLASFVGRTAGLQFLEQKFGSDSTILTDAKNSYDDDGCINAFLRKMVNDLQALYAQPISREEKLTQREPIFQAARDRFTAEVQPTLHNPELYKVYANFPYNNAFLLVNVRYNTDLQIFNDVFERNQNDWSATLAIFAAAAQTNDPFGYLRTYLGSN